MRNEGAMDVVEDTRTGPADEEAVNAVASDPENGGVNSGNDDVVEDTRAGPVDVEIFSASDPENGGVNSGNDGGADEDTRTGSTCRVSMILLACFFDFDFIGSSSRFFLFKF